MERFDAFLTEQDRRVYAAAGYGKRMELGSRPALLVIDATYEFTGLEREPVLEAVKKIHTACGETAWRAVDRSVPLVELARARNVPVLYTKMDREGTDHPYAGKNQRAGESGAYSPQWFQIVKELAPRAGDVTIPKLSPSAFQGTNLLYHLVRRNVDTVLLTGGTTSGCVRATAVDAFACGFRVGVISDCVFDRFELSHAASLFDMNAKYANVMPADQAAAYLDGCVPI